MAVKRHPSGAKLWWHQHSCSSSRSGKGNRLHEVSFLEDIVSKLSGNLNGSRRMVRKNTKTDGQKQSETDDQKMRENKRKNAKTGENKRKQANKRVKTIGVRFVDRFLAIFQWQFSGDHVGFS